MALKARGEFSGTLPRWWDGIANYFATRSSNGRTEGFNHARRSVLGRASPTSRCRNSSRNSP